VIVDSLDDHSVEQADTTDSITATEQDQGEGTGMVAADTAAHGSQSTANYLDVGPDPK
jgi:hypothetical protein